MGGLTDVVRRGFFGRKNVNICVMKMNASMRSDGTPGKGARRSPGGVSGSVAADGIGACAGFLT